MTFGDDPWRVGHFDAKDSANRSLMSPRVVPDPVPSEVPKFVSVFWGVIALVLLGVAQGTLAWVALLWAASLGWLSDSPAWWPVVAIALAVTFIRGFDRSVFRR